MCMKMYGKKQCRDDLSVPDKESATRSSSSLETHASPRAEIFRENITCGADGGILLNGCQLHIFYESHCSKLNVKWGGLDACGNGLLYKIPQWVTRLIC